MRRQKAFKACLVGAIAAAFGGGALTVQAQDLKKYEFEQQEFLGSIRRPIGSWATRRRSRRGSCPIRDSRRRRRRPELEKMLANVKLPPGFKITV